MPGSDDQLGGYGQLNLSGNSGGVRIRTVCRANRTY